MTPETKATMVKVAAVGVSMLFGAFGHREYQQATGPVAQAGPIRCIIETPIPVRLEVVPLVRK